MSKRVRGIAGRVHNVIGLDKCFVRKMGFSFFVDLHIVVNGNLTVREGHKIAHRVEGHVRALLLENISRTHLFLYALHSEDEETDRVKVRARVKSAGPKDDLLEQIIDHRSPQSLLRRPTRTRFPNGSS